MPSVSKPLMTSPRIVLPSLPAARWNPSLLTVPEPSISIFGRPLNPRLGRAVDHDRVIDLIEGSDSKRDRPVFVAIGGNRIGINVAGIVCGNVELNDVKRAGRRIRGSDRFAK